MSVDEQIERVRDWVYDGPGDSLFEPDATAHAMALWRTVRSVDAATTPEPLAQRLQVGNALLGRFHQFRYQVCRDLVDLAKAVVCLELVADDHRLVPPALAEVVGRFTRREEQARVGGKLLDAWLSSPEDALLDAGIQLLTLSAYRRPDLLSRLCLAHRRRYERTGSASDLGQAIEAGEEAMALVPSVETWAHLAEAYLCRHAVRPDLTDLRQAIALLERAASHDEQAHARLGAAYRLLHEQTGDDEALDLAVNHGERGEDPAELSVTLLRRFHRHGSPPDLARAVALVDEYSVDPGTVTGTMSVLLAKHEHGSDQADLDRAVRLGEKVIADLRDDDQHRPGVLRVVAVTLHRRYLHSGTETDLDRATTLARWAVHAFPPHHPTAKLAAVDLAALHLTRHVRSGVRAELDRAVELAERAVADDCPPEWTATLARALLMRYLVTGTRQDVDDAISLGERAVSETPARDVALPSRQTDLAGAYRARYTTNTDPTDLDQAIELGAGSVGNTHDTHIDLPWRLADLATAHLDRYRARSDPADLDTAQALGERAWHHPTAADHPGRVRLAATLADILLVRLDIGTQVAPELLAELTSDVAESRAAVLVDKVAGLHAVGVLIRAAGDAKRATSLLDSAVALLPALSPREAGWTDRQQRVGNRLGLVEAAASAHCAIDDPAGAVEVAELGRGVLLATEANTRVDLTELRDQQPRLADRFEWVRERLNAPYFPTDERKRWWESYDAQLTKIRALPGFVDFLAAPNAENLRPETGTAVLLNADRDSGHAVLVHADTAPETVALPHLRDVDTRVEHLLDAVADGTFTRQLRRRRVVPDVLAWLWDTVVEPVILALSPVHFPHRVWWVPTGVLGLLPLHAAGRPDQPGALDLLVSSFIPSLRGLRAARHRPPTQARREFVVAMPHTPGHRDLPATAAEAASLPGTHLRDTNAVTDAVLAALATSTRAHFACHASADPLSPAEGGLHLHDDILRLPQIGGLRLQDAELAYLSACATANHGTRHADEVLHLASAFQLAGFRHVIATLWPLTDRIAAQAARAFYRQLPDTSATDTAAAVLHKVTQDLRTTHPDRPDLWAALVHSGP
jgi:hypothetical protein